MSTARAPAHRAPHPTSAADLATAPSTTEASRPASARGTASTSPPSPSGKAPARRPGLVDWNTQLGRLDELRDDAGALPRGALVALAEELGVKAGTVYSQMSRRRRDNAFVQRGRDQASTSAAAPGLAAAPPGASSSTQASPPSPHAPRLAHRGQGAAHRVEVRCPACAALLTLTLAATSCSDPTEPELIHSGSPSPDQAPTLAPTEPGPELAVNPQPPEPCPRKTSP